MAETIRWILYVKNLTASSIDLEVRVPRRQRLRDSARRGRSGGRRSAGLVDRFQTLKHAWREGHAVGRRQRGRAAVQHRAKPLHDEISEFGIARKTTAACPPSGYCAKRLSV